MGWIGIFGKILKKEGKDAEKELLRNEERELTRPHGGRVLRGAGSVVSGVGTAATVVAGGMAVKGAFDEFEDLQRMGGFFKFLMECVTDPAHIEKHFHEFMTGKSEDPKPEQQKDGQGVTAGAFKEAHFEDAGGAAKPLRVISTDPRAPDEMKVPVGGEALSVRNFAGLSQKRDLSGAPDATLAGNYSEAWEKGGQVGTVYEFHSKTPQGNEFVERVAAVDRDHFILLKSGLGAGYGVSPFDGLEGQKKLQDLRRGVEHGDLSGVDPGSLGRLYDVRERASAGSPVRFGAMMKSEDLERLNGAIAPLGDLSVSSRESGFFRKGPESQTIAEFKAAGGPSLSFSGENGSMLKIAGGQGEAITALRQDGQFQHSAIVYGGHGVTLDAGGKLSVSEEGGRTLGAASRVAAQSTELELVATQSSLRSGRANSVIDSKGEVIGQMMTFQSRDGKSGSVMLQDGHAFFMNGEGKVQRVDDPQIKVDPKTGAVDLGKEKSSILDFFKAPELKADPKGNMVEIGGSASDFVESLKGGGKISAEPLVNGSGVGRAPQKDDGRSR